MTKPAFRSSACTRHRVIYACDDRYASLTAISAVSLLRHNPGCEIDVLGYQLHEDSITLIREHVERQGGRFRLLDVSPAIARLEALGATAYVSYAVYSRIFIPELLDGQTGTVLYLDCDTLVVGNLDALFASDLTHHPLALAPDAVHPAYKRVIALPDDKPYFNTGVLLMNLDLWRKRRCTERLLAELQHPRGRNPLGDQDIIVRVLGDETLALDRRWNFLSQFILSGRPENPAIYHFSGNTLGRPWFTSSRHPQRHAYRQLAAEIGLGAVTEQVRPMGFAYRLQYVLFRLLPRRLFVPICNLMYRMHIRLTYGV